MSSPKWFNAPKGEKFVLTARGFENARIRAKLELHAPMYHQYCHCVPMKWYSDGFVKLVKEGECCNGTK